MNFHFFIAVHKWPIEKMKVFGELLHFHAFFCLFQITPSHHFRLNYFIMCFSYNITYLKYLHSEKIIKIIKFSEKLKIILSRILKVDGVIEANTWYPFFLYFYILVLLKLLSICAKFQGYNYSFSYIKHEKGSFNLSQGQIRIENTKVGNKVTIIMKGKTKFSINE